MSKLDLSTRETAIKGGEHGAVIIPGKDEQSRLYRLVAGLDKPIMPLGMARLSEEDITDVYGELIPQIVA